MAIKNTPTRIKNWLLAVLLSAAILEANAQTAAPPPRAKESTEASPKLSSSIRSISISRPNLVVRGAYLARVEICAVPSGTGIDPDTCGLLGLAKRITSAGQREMWVLPIPDPPTASSGLLATEIYAKGYDEQGVFIGRTSLPYSGVSSLNDALWEHANPKVFSKVCRIEEKDSGKQFTYPESKEFAVILDASRYAKADLVLDCAPGNVVGPHPYVTPPSVSPPLYAVMYGTNKPGSCTITNKGFKVSIVVKY